MLPKTIIIMSSQKPALTVSSAEKFKAAGLRQRVATGLVLAAAFFAAVLYSSLFWFQMMMGLIFLLAAWEWADLSECGAMPVRMAYSVVTALCIFLLKLEIFPDIEVVNIETLTQLMLTTVCFWFWVLSLILTYPRSVRVWSSRPVRLLMGFMLLLPCWVGLVFLKQQDVSGYLILWVVGIVAAADIGAYFAGVRFGKHKIAPQISPGKSWEGVWGGMLANVAFAFLIAGILKTSAMETVLLIALSLLVGGTSVLGDLFESMMKRHRGVKDSGSLLPGHGGILDRIDGWTVAVPIFVLAYLYGATH